MKTTFVLAFTAALAATTATACKKKDADKKSDTAGDTKGANPKPADPGTPGTPPADPKPADPTPPPAAPAKLVEVDLSPWGGPFAGMVAMAPEGSKVQFDDPSRQLMIDDTDFISVSEAAGWDDANSEKGLSGDPDNKEIKAGPTESHWVRNPPLGKQWNFDTKLELGGATWSCNGATFTSADVEAKLTAICKSIKKK